MARNVLKRMIKINGMTCTGCELKIENTLKKLPGVIQAKVRLSSSSALVVYDADVISLKDIIKAIEKLHYVVEDEDKTFLTVQKRHQRTATISKDRTNNSFFVGIGIILLALYLMIKNTVGFNFIPEINQSMGYGLLFAVGLLTSLHCVAMCGGIHLSVCTFYPYDSKQAGKFSRLKPSLLYNAGRVTSYTVIGGIVGALGSLISFSGAARGLVSIVAGIFMVIMGLNALAVFPWLRNLQPRMPKIFGEKIYHSKGRYGPYYVGLLNGLMPCGPLQSMQLYALGTGSFVAGAMSMFTFSMGTVPLMFGLGAVSSLLSGKFTQKMMKASAVLVMGLGIVMINRGLSLSGFHIFSPSSGFSNVAKIEGDVQVVTTKLEAGRYPPIVVQKGIPVRWIIKVEEDDLNGCNNPFIIPKYNKQYTLTVGENVIEFVPEEEGNILYTCWMGMIRSYIRVVDNINNVDLNQIKNEVGNDTPFIGSGFVAGGCH